MPMVKQTRMLEAGPRLFKADSGQSEELWLRQHKRYEDLCRLCKQVASTF